VSSSTKAAFLSTPSVYFSLPRGTELQQQSWLFDLDPQWAALPCFCKFDFQAPEAIPAELHHAFDAIVIDPPFITAEVWGKYAQAAQLLLKPEGERAALQPGSKHAAAARALHLAPLTMLPPPVGRWRGAGGAAACARHKTLAARTVRVQAR
jgi:hypothetical protein